MAGAILCKHQDNIVVLSYGEYREQEKMIDVCKKVVKHDQIKLVEFNGNNIGDIMKSQDNINETFAKEFN